MNNGANQKLSLEKKKLLKLTKQIKQTKLNDTDHLT